MKAYYIHWSYPASADDQLYYGGDDDRRLFHYKENADKLAQDLMNHYQEMYGRWSELFHKHMAHESTPEEDEEYYNMQCCGDLPSSYTICEREIEFEDEE